MLIWSIPLALALASTTPVVIVAWPIRVAPPPSLGHPLRQLPPILPKRMSSTLPPKHALIGGGPLGTLVRALLRRRLRIRRRRRRCPLRSPTRLQPPTTVGPIPPPRASRRRRRRPIPISVPVLMRAAAAAAPQPGVSPRRRPPHPHRMHHRRLLAPTLPTDRRNPVRLPAGVLARPLVGGAPRPLSPVTAQLPPPRVVRSTNLTRVNPALRHHRTRATTTNNPTPIRFHNLLCRNSLRNSLDRVSR